MKKLDIILGVLVSLLLIHDLVIILTGETLSLIVQFINTFLLLTFMLEITYRLIKNSDITFQYNSDDEYLNNELYSNVDGTVIVVTDSTIVIEDEKGLIHTYKNLCDVWVEVGEIVEEGEDIGELNLELYYEVDNNKHQEEL